MEAKGYMAAKTSNVIIIGYGNTIATQGSYDNAENEILSEIPLAKHKCDENNFTNPEIIVVIPDDAYGNSINTNKIKQKVIDICGVEPIIIVGPCLHGSVEERLERDRKSLQWMLDLYAMITNDEERADLWKQCEEVRIQYESGIPTPLII